MELSGTYRDASNVNESRIASRRNPSTYFNLKQFIEAFRPSSTDRLILQEDRAAVSHRESPNRLSFDDESVDIRSAIMINNMRESNNEYERRSAAINNHHFGPNRGDFERNISVSSCDDTYTLRSKTIPIYNWDVKFSGEVSLVSPQDMPIDEFLYLIKVKKDAQRISDEDLLWQISSLLTHSAYTWYYAYYNTFTNWQSFVEAIRRRFVSNFHYQDTLDMISSRPQRDDEPTMAYMNRMVLLFRSVLLDFKETLMIHLIIRNMRPEVQTRIKVWGPRTLFELEGIISRMEILKSSVAFDA